MAPLLVYVVKSIVVSGVLFGWYLITLRNKRLHYFNRAYLLLTVLLGIAAPLLHWQWGIPVPANGNAVVKLLSVVSAAGGEESMPNLTASVNWWNVTEYVYWSVAGLLTIVLAVKITRILLSARTWVQGPNGVRIVAITNGTPYSFLKWLFWNPAVDMDSVEGKRIWKHEAVHIRQLHSVDKLLVSGACCLFWANPVLWLVRRELGMVHEFLADEAAVDGDTAGFAAMLLHARLAAHRSSLVQSFFHSPIKRRLLMLKTSKKRHALRMLAALPVAAITVALCSFSFVKRPVAAATPTNGAMVIVLDAGHGGVDAGGVGIGGVKEKDLCLAITTQLAKLAPQYNIAVVSTRSGDNYPELAERAAKSAESNAKAFVSIHVNKDEDGVPAHKGYEVYISKKNTHYKESRVLASSVMAQLDPSKATLKEKGLVVLNTNAVPAILIECGNIDRADDIATITDPARLEKLCRNILSGIAQYNTIIANDHKK